MIVSSEIVNVRSFKSKDKDLYIADILVIDTNGNSCIHSQFINADKYNELSNTLEKLRDENKRYVITNCNIIVRNNDLVIVFEL